MANPQLDDLVRNAELAIDYAAKNSVDLPRSLLSSVAATRAAIDSGSVTEELETAFYEAYLGLANAIKPATIGGIRDSSDLFGWEVRRIPWIGKPRRISLARRAITHFRSGTFAALIALLAAQAYWAIGSKTISDIGSLFKVIDDPKAESSIKDDAAFALETQFFLLDVWAKWLPGRSMLERSLASPDDKESAGRFTLDPKAKEYSGQVNRVHLIISQHALSVLQVYVLPLFYGLLGAFTYVLRQLTIETRTKTFRADAVPTYWLRVFLGMVAGLALGWFLQPQEGGKTIASLTPFALSFLAGYSVDVLFTAMDKLVEAFGSFAKTSKG